MVSNDMGHIERMLRSCNTLVQLNNALNHVAGVADRWVLRFKDDWMHYNKKLKVTNDAIATINEIYNKTYEKIAQPAPPSMSSFVVHGFNCYKTNNGNEQTRESDTTRAYTSCTTSSDCDPAHNGRFAIQQMQPRQ
jgi:hypothetical protein